MKNEVLAAQLNALHGIGLDRVNTAVAAATAYIEVLEEGVPSPQIEADVAGLKANLDTLEAEYATAQEQIVSLQADVASLQDELSTANSHAEFQS